MNSPAGQDRLFASLNPLVVDGTLTPQQADRVYRAVGSGGEEPSPADVTRAEAWERPRLFAALAVFAGGLLASCYLVAATVDGQHDDFTGKTFTLMLVAVLVGAAAAAALLLRVRDSVWGLWASGVLGALALAGFSLAFVVLWNKDALLYVTGLLMLAGGVAGFWYLKGHLYAVVAVFGGLIALGQAFSDLLGSGADEGDALSVGIGFLFYGLAVAAGGWLLPCRHLLGVIGLGIGVVAMFVVMLFNAAAAMLSAAFSDPSLGGNGLDSVRSDILVALILGLLVAAVAAGAHAYSGLVGFSVVAVAAATILPLTAVVTMQTAHPLRWATGFGVVATLGLAAVIVMQLDRRTPTPHHGYAGTPLPHDHDDHANADTIAR